MELAVVGGTGACGALVVAEARRRGHTARVLARRPGPGGYAVDLATGSGLPEAVSGVNAVIDTSNSVRPGRMRDVLVDGTRRLLRAERATGVPHHVLVSIAGIDRTPMSYYRNKLDQEQVVRGADVSATIVRATQFHHLVDQAMTAFARLGALPRSSLLLQPVNPTAVAAALVNAAERDPGADAEIAGPEVSTLTELATIWSTVLGRRRLPLPIPLPPALAEQLRAGSLTAPGAPRGTVTFEAWLRSRREREQR